MKINTNTTLIAVTAVLTAWATVRAANWLPSSDSQTNRVEFTAVDSYGRYSATVTNTPPLGSLLLGRIVETNETTRATKLLAIGGGFQWICPTGYSTFYNPFVSQFTNETPNYSVTNVLSDITNNTVIYTFLQASNQYVSATAGTNGTWTDPNFKLYPNRPLFVGNFSGSPFTNVFIGFIRTGDFTNRIVPGNNFLCSQIFKDGCIMEQDPNGTITQRGMAINVSDNNDTVKVFHDGAWRESEYVDEEWSAISGYYVQVNLGPKIQIGQCFMYHNGTAATNIWIQGAHY